MYVCGVYNRVYIAYVYSTFDIRYAARLTSNGCETRINEF